MLLTSATTLWCIFVMNSTLRSQRCLWDGDGRHRNTESMRFMPSSHLSASMRDCSSSRYIPTTKGRLPSAMWLAFFSTRSQYCPRYSAAKTLVDGWPTWLVQAFHISCPALTSRSWSCAKLAYRAART